MNGFEPVKDLAGADEQRKSGLEDVYGFNFVNLVPLYGRNRVPPLPVSDFVDPHFFPAPRSEDDFGIPPDDFFGFHAALTGNLPVFQFFKDVFPSALSNQLAGPTDAGNQRKSAAQNHNAKGAGPGHPTGSRPRRESRRRARRPGPLPGDRLRASPTALLQSTPRPESRGSGRVRRNDGGN